MQSILSIDAPGSITDEQVPHSGLPWVWVGYFFAFAFFVAEVIDVFLQLPEVFNIVLVFIALGGWIYWLFCVHRFHKILAEMTAGRYTIEPSTAVGYHFVPFYNFYWLFKWPAALADYLNGRGRVHIINGYLIGALLLLATLLRLFDGAIGLAVLFTVTLYVASKLRRHVEQVKGTNPGMLPPPPPDSRIFTQGENYMAQPPSVTEPQPQSAAEQRGETRHDNSVIEDNRQL